MRRRICPASGALAAALLAVFLFAREAPAQTTAPLASLRTAEIGDLLRRGRELELQRRWGEAVAHYEEAVRQFPGEASLQRRFDYTRLHYDVNRRYADRSFRLLLAQLTLQQALDLYSEVMLKLQAHYVEMPKWKELVERGTNDFEVALSEAAFLETQAGTVDQPALDAFRRELRQVLGPMMVQSRSDAAAAVATAAQLAQQRIGLAPSAVVLEYTCGATNSLDPYSAYLTPDQLAEVYSQIEGNFVGLGVELKAQDGALLIVRVIPGSPAEQSGVVAGDRITAVDDQPTAQYSTDQAANLLQGEEGTVVNLTLLGADQKPRRAAVRRQRVEVPSVDTVKILEGTDHVGYLRLTCFQKTTPQDLDNALWALHRAGMKSLIMDLRGNPGGLLITAVEVADRFIPNGVIVSTHGRSVQEDFTYSAHEPGTWRVPLVVLIDQDSASAAEIFAGAIRDHRRGIVVGARSYGKGSVQGIFALNCAQAGVRLTTAKFYSPNGSPYAGIGVEPNILVHQAARPVQEGQAIPSSAGDDAILAAGIQAVQQVVAQR
ncbi:MAG: S41 family peptidase [Pirellulales bacterium]|nr:S41 family peptidase [Pirellulales bacterium]